MALLNIKNLIKRLESEEPDTDIEFIIVNKETKSVICIEVEDSTNYIIKFLKHFK